MGEGMSYFVAILAIAFIVLLHKKLKKWCRWYVVLPLALVGAAALANTTLGRWAANGLEGLVGLLAGAIGMSTPLLATGLMLILLALVLYGYIHDRKADRTEIIGTFVLPLLFLIATGPIAGAGSTFFDSIAAVGTSAFGGLT